MLKKKPAAVPTIEERLASSAAMKGAALSIFETVVEDLKTARDEAREVEAIALAEIERLRAIAYAAYDEAVDADVKATNITTFALGK